MGYFHSWPDWGTKTNLHILFLPSEKNVAGDFLGRGSFILLNAWRELGIEEWVYIDIKGDFYIYVHILTFCCHRQTCLTLGKCVCVMAREISICR